MTDVIAFSVCSCVAFFAVQICVLKRHQRNPRGTKVISRNPLDVAAAHRRVIGAALK